MRVFDTTIYFNELDVLEIRLHVLAPVVDTFVIVESDRTHLGAYKGHALAEHLDRFHDFRIQYHPESFGPLAEGESCWQRQARTRDLAAEYANPEPDDLVLISDVDEIPDPALVARRAVGRYRQQMSYFWLNAICGVWTLGTVGVRGRDVRNGTADGLKYHQPLREHPNAGWHFGYMGGEESVRAKLAAAVHTELGSAEQQQIVVERRSALRSVHGEPLEVVPITAERFPAWVVENQDRYSHLIRIANA